MLAQDIQACQVDGYDSLAEFGEIPLIRQTLILNPFHVHIFDSFAENLRNPLYPFIEIMSGMLTL